MKTNEQRPLVFSAVQVPTDCKINVDDIINDVRHRRTVITSDVVIAVIKPNWFTRFLLWIGVRKVPPYTIIKNRFGDRTGKTNLQVHQDLINELAGKVYWEHRPTCKFTKI